MISITTSVTKKHDLSFVCMFLNNFSGSKTKTMFFLFLFCKIKINRNSQLYIFLNTMGSEYWVKSVFRTEIFGNSQWKPEQKNTLLLTLVGFGYWTWFGCWYTKPVLKWSIFAYWGSEHWEWSTLYMSIALEVARVGSGYRTEMNSGKPDWFSHDCSSSDSTTGYYDNLTQRIFMLCL